MTEPTVNFFASWACPECGGLNKINQAVSGYSGEESCSKCNHLIYYSYEFGGNDVENTISELQEEAHRISKENGFWDDFKDLEAHLKDNKPDSLAEYKFAVYSQKIALINSELSEGLEGLREDNLKGIDGLQEELADTVIRILDLAGKLQFDLEQAIVEKMERNKEREEKHGKNF